MQACMCAKLLIMFDSLQPYGLYSPPGSSVHGDSPVKNAAVGFHTLLQGIFLTRDQTPFSCSSGTAGGFFTTELPGIS